MASPFLIINPNAAAQPLASTELGESPYLHDPTNSLVITETATSLAQPLEANHQYPSVQVASTVGFPDTRGYVVFAPLVLHYHPVEWSNQQVRMADAAGPSVPEQTYARVASGQNYRVGIISERPEAGPPAISIEFLLRLFEVGQKLEPGRMETAMAISRTLMAHGYSVYFQDDGWVSCERPAGGMDAAVEARLLRDIVGG